MCPDQGVPGSELPGFAWQSTAELAFTAQMQWINFAEGSGSRQYAVVEEVLGNVEGSETVATKGLHLPRGTRNHKTQKISYVHSCELDQSSYNDKALEKEHNTCCQKMVSLKMPYLLLQPGAAASGLI